MKISSTYALLDVKKGRAELAKSVGLGKTHPIMITGYIDRQYGSDDGISIEFVVIVTGLKLGSAEENTDA